MDGWLMATLNRVGPCLIAVTKSSTPVALETAETKTQPT